MKMREVPVQQYDDEPHIKRIFRGNNPTFEKPVTLYAFFDKQHPKKLVGFQFHESWNEDVTYSFYTDDAGRWRGAGGEHPEWMLDQLTPVLKSIDQEVAKSIKYVLEGMIKARAMKSDDATRRLLARIGTLGGF